MRKVKPRWRPLTSNRKQFLYHFPPVKSFFLTDRIANQVVGTLFVKMAEIGGAIGRQFQSLSIVFVCAVNTKLACVAGPQFYGEIRGQDFGGHGGGFSPVPAKILLAANQAPHKIEGLHAG
jgi:hypothetical protein